MQTRVVSIFGENTPPLDKCPHCANTVHACNTSGCGGRRYPGWREDHNDIPPF
jgi:hypothetical protein